MANIISVAEKSIPNDVSNDAYLLGIQSDDDGKQAVYRFPISEVASTVSDSTVQIAINAVKAANTAIANAEKLNIKAKQIPSGIEVTVTDRDGKDTTIQMKISIASDNELKEMMDDVFGGQGRRSENVIRS